MKIVCFGDSNTWGYDPRGYFGGRYDHPWPGILAEKLGCTVINQGENGREIPLGTVTFPADADLLIVMLGTNDLLRGLSAEAVCDRMERFLVSMKPDRQKILLVAPPSMKRGTWVPDQMLIEESKRLAVLYSALCRRLGIRFADAGQGSVPVAYDGVHLTSEGHGCLVKILHDKLGKILNATGG